jgi:hypothetical protein
MRGRNRNNNNSKGPNPLTKSYESNGPDVKIRGTAQHVAEKYSQLARDALSSGDPVSAENYFQHAEHYYRIIAAAQEQLREQYGYQQRPFDEDGNEEEGFGQGNGSGFERQGGGQDFGNGEEADYGSQPQPYENRGERPARFDRQDRQDRQDRNDRPERQDRQDRNDRQDRGERRERFQRDRNPRQDGPRQDSQRQDSPRQDFQRDDQPFEARSENGERSERPARFERPDRNDRQDRQDRHDRNDRPERTERFERGDRPERRERFPRDRRRDEAEPPEQGTLPAFLTNPVRTVAPAPVEETQAPVVQDAANDQEAPRPRRRRRTRQEMIDAANAENGGFASDAVETPAAE